MFLPTKKFRKVLLLILIPFFIIGLFVYFTWLVEPASAINNLLISNITDHQATVSWTTNIPTKGTILISSDNKFPLLPMFASKIQKDDGEKLLPKINRYNTHHFTIGSLLSSKNYNFRIYQGQKKVFEGQFQTGPTLSTLLNPNPVYGQVVKSDRKTAVIGALVYLKVSNQASSSALLSTLTNQTGGYTFDLSNIRTENLDAYLPMNQKSVEEIVVDQGKQGRVKAQSSLGKDKPWPNIIIK